MVEREREREEGREKRRRESINDVLRSFPERRDRKKKERSIFLVLFAARKWRKKDAITSPTVGVKQMISFAGNYK